MDECFINFLPITYHLSLFTWLLVSSVRQHLHHPIVIGFRDQRIDIEVPFSFVGFFRQYVARMRVTTLNFPGCGGSKSLCCALVCF